MTGFIIFLIFIVLNINLAELDAYKIKNNKRIMHAVNALFYIACILPFYNFLTPGIVLGVLLVRIPIFNTALNIFRGLKADHISHTTTSIIDQMTNKIIEKVGYWYYHGLLFIGSLLLVLV